MISPTHFNSYPDYVSACKSEAEVPADYRTWRSWCTPPIPAAEVIQLSPSAYLQWLVEQLPGLKDAAHSEEPNAEILWNVIRELRSQDIRLRVIEKALERQEGDHR